MKIKLHHRDGVDVYHPEAYPIARGDLLPDCGPLQRFDDGFSSGTVGKFP
ncbi:MAG: hypothetical protein AAF214_12500 [Pseudomonadota bacterium]